MIRLVPRNMPRSMMATTLTFLIAAELTTMAVWRWEQYRLGDERARILELAGDYAHAIERHIEQTLSAAFAMAALVRQGDGDIQNFDTVARQMLLFFPGASELALAPGGIVQRVAPLSGNTEQAIGLDLFNSPERAKEAAIARDTGKLTLAGPLPLAYGKLGIAGRLPVFMDNAQGRPSFWGFAIVVMHFPEALDPIQLTRLTQRNLAYKLWRIHPSSGRSQIIAESSPTSLIAPVQHPVEVPNAAWTLSVAPAQGWGNPFGLLFSATLGLLFSMLLAYLVKLLVEAKAHRHELEGLVAQRTAELEQFVVQLQLAEMTIEKCQTSIFWLDAQGKTVRVNDYACHNLGYSRDELIGLYAWDFDPDFHQEDWPAFWGHLKEHGNHRIESRHQRKDGSIFPIEVIASYMSFGDRELDFVFVNDISARKAAEDALRHKERYQRALLDNFPFLVWLKDKESRFLAVNQAFARSCGVRDTDDVVGKTDIDLWPRDLATAYRVDDQAVLASGKTQQTEELIECTSRPRRWFETYKSPVVLEGCVIGTVGFARDITERKQAEIQLWERERALRMSEARYRALVDLLPYGVQEYDCTGCVTFANPALQRLHGPSVGQCVWNFLVDPADRDALRNHLHDWVRDQPPPTPFFAKSRHVDGYSIDIQMDWTYRYDARNQLQGFISVITDITERKQMQEALREQAIRDPLTGLFNRRYLDETLLRELNRCQRNGEPLVVAMLDLDHFKRFNDVYGHDIGDQVLQKVGLSLRQSLRVSDIACRYGGEELTIVMPGSSLEDARFRLEQVRRNICQLRLHVQNSELPAVTVSIGVAAADLDNTEAAMLLNRADVALYEAKRQGRNRVVVADKGQSR